MTSVHLIGTAFRSRGGPGVGLPAFTRQSAGSDRMDGWKGTPRVLAFDMDIPLLSMTGAMKGVLRWPTFIVFSDAFQEHAMRGCKGYLLFIAVVLSFTGCDDDSGGASAGAVRIGGVYPLSGPQAAAGKEIRQGIELAVDVVNNAYPELDIPLAHSRGLPALGGRPIDVVLADHQSTRAGAREGSRRLILDSNVAALMGAYESERTREASEIAEEAGIPFLTAMSTSSALTERGFDWFFRTTPTDTVFVRDAFEFITDLGNERNTNLTRLAVIHEGSAFGTGFMDLVNTWAPQYGKGVVAEVTTQGATGPVSEQVAEVRAAGPDVVLFAVYAEDAIAYMQEFKRQDYAPALIWADDAGFISPDFQQALGADAAYVTSREVWSPDLTQFIPLAARVNAMYRQRYGQDMNGNSARAFIGMITLAEAINRAGSTGPDAVREALRATDIPAEQLIMPWRGIRFDSSGQNTLGDGLVVQVLDGRYRTVWPYAISVEQVVYPYPGWSAR